MQHDHFDILICGAGLIGASLALALAPLSLRIALTESLPLKTEIDLNKDGRSLALNYASVKILAAIGVWPALKDLATPIKTVHISERGRFGKVRFNAEDEKIDALGYVVPAPALAATLNQALKAQTAHLTLFNPATVIELRQSSTSSSTELNPHYSATLQTEAGRVPIKARLVIAADGVDSSLRQLMGITAKTVDYAQSALATRIKTTLPLQNIAYERFCADGTLALLPLPENNAALIFTGSTEFIQSLNALNEQEFLQRAQQYFGERLGAFAHLSKRHIYPLQSVTAQEQVKGNFVLLGNAAHTLHPIAAQGFNLGLQDVAQLAETIAQAWQARGDLAELMELQNYAQLRAGAQRQTLRFTQNLISIFAHDFLPLALARSTALKMLDLMPPLKHLVAARLLGTAGKATKLALGIPLHK